MNRPTTPTSTLSVAVLGTLVELDMMDGATDPDKEIGRAMAATEQALETQSRLLAVGYCQLAAARLMRAAELLIEQNAAGPEPDGDPLLAGQQVAGDAGSEPGESVRPPASSVAPATPSPPAATVWADPIAPIEHSLGIYEVGKPS